MPRRGRRRRTPHDAPDVTRYGGPRRSGPPSIDTARRFPSPALTGSGRRGPATREIAAPIRRSQSTASGLPQPAKVGCRTVGAARLRPMRGRSQRRARRRNGLPGRLARCPGEPCRVGVQRHSPAGVEVLQSFLVKVMRGRSRETRRCTARSGRGVTTRPARSPRATGRGPGEEVKDRGRGDRRRDADGGPVDEPVEVEVPAVYSERDEHRGAAPRSPPSAGRCPTLVGCRADAARAGWWRPPARRQRSTCSGVITDRPRRTVARRPRTGSVRSGVRPRQPARCAAATQAPCRARRRAKGRPPRPSRSGR